MCIRDSIPPGAQTDKGKKARAEEPGRANVYDQAGENTSGNLTAADAKRLTNKGGYLPAEWNEADAQIELYLPMLALALGVTHVVTLQHKKAIKLYHTCKISLQYAMERDYGKKVAPSLLVYYFYMHYRAWFVEQWQFDSTAIVDPPEVLDGLRKYAWIKQMDWLPALYDAPALVALSSKATPRRVPVTGPQDDDNNNNTPPGGR